MLRRMRLFTLVTASILVLVACGTAKRVTAPANDFASNIYVGTSELALQVSSVCMTLESPFADHHEADKDLFAYTVIQQTNTSAANVTIDNSTDMFMIDFKAPGTTEVTIKETPGNQIAILRMVVASDGDVSIEIVQSFWSTSPTYVVTETSDPNNIVDTTVALSTQAAGDILLLDFLGTTGVATLKIVDSQWPDLPVTMTVEANCIPQATIRIGKVISDESDEEVDTSTKFDFALMGNYLDDATASIATGSYITITSNVFAGPLEVSAQEVDLPEDNWSLVDVGCSPTSEPTTVFSDATITSTGFSATLVDGDDVTCTFTNKYHVPKAKLTIVKAIDESSDTDYPALDFDFSTTVLGTSEDITLIEDGSKTYTSTPGEYSVTESSLLDIDNWTLESVACSNANTSSSTDMTATVAGGFSKTLVDGDDVTCTFTNKYTAPPPTTGCIKVIKVIKDIASSPDDFEFQWKSSANTDLPNFFLDVDDDATNPSEKEVCGLNPDNNVRIQEKNPGRDWEVTNVVCVSTNMAPIVDFRLTANGRQAHFDLRAGEYITCTFENTDDTGPR